MTVSGLKPTVNGKSGYSISEEALRALQSGDVNALMDAHRGRWNLFMGPDDGDDDDSNDDDDNAGNGDSGDSGSGDDNDGDDDDDAGSDDDDDKVTKADLIRMEKRMKAADKRASEAEAKLRKIDDGKKDDLTRATDRVTELEGENATLKETLTSLRLNNAFLASNKHTWHKPSAALKLAQSEGYFDDLIDDDGVVDEKGMSKALDRLAKEHEYLVKKATSGGSSGDSAGGRSNNGKDDKQKDAEMRRRAPALARRR